MQQPALNTDLAVSRRFRPCPPVARVCAQGGGEGGTHRQREREREKERAATLGSRTGGERTRRRKERPVAFDPIEARRHSGRGFCSILFFLEGDRRREENDHEDGEKNSAGRVWWGLRACCPLIFRPRNPTLCLFRDGGGGACLRKGGRSCFRAEPTHVRQVQFSAARRLVGCRRQNW